MTLFGVTFRGCVVELPRYWSFGFSVGTRGADVMLGPWTFAVVWG